MLRYNGFAALLSLSVGLFASVGSQAATLPVYSDKGTENPLFYSFIATGGDVTAYFAGSTAVYNDSLGLLVNGSTVASGVLANHSSALGASFNFGSFAAGTALTFFTLVQQTGQTFYSDKSLNKDGVNHVYSTAFAGSGNIPAGTYVGFEDLRGGGDKDYNDTTFVLTNTTTTLSAVPLPASAPLFGAALLGLTALGYAAKRNRGATAEA